MERVAFLCEGRRLHVIWWIVILKYSVRKSFRTLLHLGKLVLMCLTFRKQSYYVLLTQNLSLCFRVIGKVAFQLIMLMNFNEGTRCSDSILIFSSFPQFSLQSRNKSHACSFIMDLLAKSSWAQIEIVKLATLVFSIVNISGRFLEIIYTFSFGLHKNNYFDSL